MRNMNLSRILLSALCAAALAPSVVFADAVSDAADAVEKAAKSGDDAAITAAAAKDSPDPWVVADQLLAHGATDAAAKFAKAKPRKDVEKLPAYVASRTGGKDEAARRAAVESVNAKLRAGDVAGALAAIDAAGDAPDDVAGTRLVFARALGLRATGRQAEAAKAFEDAAMHASRIGWLARASEAWEQAGMMAREIGNGLEAVRLWTAMRELDESRANVGRTARAHVLLGTAYSNIGDLDKALAAYELGAKLATQAGDTKAVAAADGNRAILLREKGDIAQSNEIFERLATLMHDTGERSNEAIIHINLSDNHRLMGDPQRALVEADRARDIAAGVNDAPLQMEVLSHRTQVLEDLGRLAEAMDALTQSCAFYEKTGNQLGLARATRSMGNLHFSMGQYAKALSLQEKALSMFEELGQASLAASALTNIGNTYYALGDYEKALDYERRGLAEFQKIGDGRGLPEIYNSIGGILLRLERYAEAVEELKKGLEAAEAVNDQVMAKKMLANLGAGYDDLGRPNEAIGYYERAVKADEELGDRAALAGTLSNLALTYAKAKQDRPKAIELLTRSVEIAREAECIQPLVDGLWNLSHQLLLAERHKESAAAAREAVLALPTLVAGFGEEQGAKMREQYAPVFEFGALAGLQMKDAAEACWFLESGRAGTLLESLGGRDSIASFAVPAELRELEGKARAELAAATDEQRAALESHKLAAIQSARKRAAAARERFADVVERIQREAKLAASVAYPRAAKLADIRAALREGDAFVEYGVFGKSAIAVVATAKEERVLLLGQAIDLDKTCSGIDPSDASADAAQGLDALRRFAVEPLALDSSVTRVLVSPDGPLSLVPFSVLFDGREVAEVPSGTAYLALAGARAEKGEQVLALGDPVYDGSGGAVATRSSQGQKLAPLPATRDEAKAVGDVVLLGADATPAGLAAAVAKRPRWHAIHLACHGLVDPERPTMSALALSADTNQDGLLKALDVFRMRLPADVVVLSACETGRGKVVRGEGIVGFTQAFMFSGAPRVVVSLWKVDDLATRALMEKFHAEWKAGVPAAKALRDAQTFVRSQEKWKHPAYWAAWVLWGLPQ
jgi:CHAT domain-containing protein/tetratricopeptide (TPR) repeat protein